MRGRLELHFQGTIVQQHTYDCKTNRDKLISKWKGLYGKGYSKTELIDIPEVTAAKVGRQKMTEEPTPAAAKSPFKKGSIAKYGKLNRGPSKMKYGLDYRGSFH